MPEADGPQTRFSSVVLAPNSADGRCLTDPDDRRGPRWSHSALGTLLSRPWLNVAAAIRKPRLASSSAAAPTRARWRVGWITGLWEQR